MSLTPLPVLPRRTVPMEFFCDMLKTLATPVLELFPDERTEKKKGDVRDGSTSSASGRESKPCSVLWRQVSEALDVQAWLACASLACRPSRVSLDLQAEFIRR